MFLHANTSIPVAHVVAWDSNSDNELGFEWLLMERIKGVTLQSVSRRMSWQEKRVLTAELAEMVKRLLEVKFDRIGSLYFESALREKSGKPEGTVHSKDSCLSRAREKQDALKIGKSTRSTNKLESQAETATMADNTEVGKEDTHMDVASKKPSVEIIRRAIPPKRDDYNNLGGFTIGPLFERIFFMDDRVYLLVTAYIFWETEDRTKTLMECSKPRSTCS